MQSSPKVLAQVLFFTLALLGEPALRAQGGMIGTSWGPLELSPNAETKRDAVLRELRSKRVIEIIEKDLELSPGALSSVEIELTVRPLEPEYTVHVSVYLKANSGYTGKVSNRIQGYAIARLKGYSSSYAEECLSIPARLSNEARHIKGTYPWVNLSRLKEHADSRKRDVSLSSVYELTDENSKRFRYHVKTNSLGDLSTIYEAPVEEQP